MKLGYHDVTVVSYETGVNDNGTKLMDIKVKDDEGSTEHVIIYFSSGSPENIRIGLEQLKELGWGGKGKPLDGIIGGKARIEVLEEPFEDRTGRKRMIMKTRFAMSSGKKPAIKSPMTKDATQSWLDGLDGGPGRSW